MRTYNKTQDYKNRLKIAGLILIIAIPFFAVRECSGQSATPFKGAKTIIFKCNEFDASLYGSIGRYLASNGYGIATSNGDFLTIKTEPKPTSRFNLLFYLQLAVVGDEIRTNVFWRINDTSVMGSNEFYQWDYAKSNMNTQKVIYDDIMKSLEGFERQSVIYY